MQQNQKALVLDRWNSVALPIAQAIWSSHVGDGFLAAGEFDEAGNMVLLAIEGYVDAAAAAQQLDFDSDWKRLRGAVRRLCRDSVAEMKIMLRDLDAHRVPQNSPVREKLQTGIMLAYDDAHLWIREIAKKNDLDPVYIRDFMSIAESLKNGNG